MSNILSGIWGQWNFDEASGQRRDGSPNENHLTEVDGPIHAEDGLINKAVNWTFAQHNFQLRNATASMDASGGMTIAFWARLDCVTNAHKTGSVQLWLNIGDTVNYVPPYIWLGIYARGSGTYPIPCLSLQSFGETSDGDYFYFLSDWDWDEPTSDIAKDQWHLFVLRVGSSGLMLTVDKVPYYHNPAIKTLPGNLTGIGFQGFFDVPTQWQNYSLSIGQNEVSLEINGSPYFSKEVTWGHIEGVKYETTFVHEVGGIPSIWSIAITADGTKVYRTDTLLIHNTTLTYPSTPAEAGTLTGSFYNYNESLQRYALMLDDAYSWERVITEEEEDELFNDGEGLDLGGEEPQPGLLDASPLAFEYSFNPVSMSIVEPTPPPTQGGGPVNPHVMLQWSDDDGNTWSNERMMPLGRVGEYTRRMKWNRLGRSRNRVFRVSISDPVRVVLRDAFIDADEGAH